MGIPSPNQVNAAMRHVYTAGGTLLTVMGALAFIPQDQVANAIAALHDVGDGLQQVFGGLSKLWVIIGPVVIGFAVKGATFAASFRSQLKSVTAIASAPQNVDATKQMVDATASLPKVVQVVTPLGDELPNPKVVTP